MNKDCNCNNNCKNNVETAYVGDIDIDTLATLPDYLIAERDIEDPVTGNIKRTITRIPTTKLFPNGNFANKVPINGNNPNINSVPEGQVIGAYMKNDLTRTVAQLAGPNNPAQFLITGVLPDGQLVIQSSGFIQFEQPHKYTALTLQYYQGEDGKPTTDPSSGQKLFVPLSDTVLEINM